MKEGASERGCCGSCGQFRNDARDLENAFPGLLAMSSAHASVRQKDGLCLLHECYLSALSACAKWCPVGSASHP